MKPKILSVQLGARFAAQQAQGHPVLDKCSLIELLSRRIDEMLPALGLPAGKLMVELDVAGAHASKFLFTLTLEETTCFGPLDQDSAGADGPERVAALILAAMFSHRDPLLVKFAADDEWERVQTALASQSISMAQPTFDAIVAAAIRHGLSVPDTIDVLIGTARRGLYLDELEDQVEAILATQARRNILIHIGSLTDADLPKLGASVRDQLFLRSGIIYPPIEIEQDEQVNPGEFRLALNELWTPPASLEITNPAETLVASLLNFAPVFTTMTAIDSALGRLAKTFPMVVFNMIEAFGTALTLRILRALVEEGVCILDLRAILGTLLELNGTLPAGYEGRAVVLPYGANFLKEPDGGAEALHSEGYADCVRVELRDQISQACADQRRVLRGFRTSPALEERLSCLTNSPLDECETFNILSAIQHTAAVAPTSTILMASTRNRRRLWDLIRYQFPHLPVLCEAELSPYVRYEELGEIQLT